ncbi:MAG TPA: GRP family sugar transporter [bacterium]|nr:GRP family sugar transporter [bacterium]
MAFWDALGAVLCLGSYMVPVRFSKLKGMAFFPPMALGILVVALLFLRGSLTQLTAAPGAFGLALLSGVFWAGGQLMANAALEQISLAKGNLLFSLNSFLNILIGLFVFKETAGWEALGLVALGGALLFAGVGWVSTVEPAQGQKENLKKGIPLALAACFFWGTYFLPLKLAPRLNPHWDLPPLVFLSGLALGGCLPGLVFWVFQKNKSLEGRSLFAGFLSAGLWAAGMAFFLLAIGSLGLARAVPIVNSNSLVYAAWSLLVFKEIPLAQTPKVLAGTLLALGGILLLARA